MNISVNGQSVLALVDSGCSKTVVRRGLVREHVEGVRKNPIVLADGSAADASSGEVQLSINGKVINVECLVMESMPFGLGVLVGMDVIERLGGVTIRKSGIEFGNGGVDKNSALGSVTTEASSIRIKKQNFEIEFEDHWVVKWDWKAGAPSYLPSWQSNFREDKSKDVATLEVLEEWKRKGYLIDYDEKMMGKSIGSIPIFGIIQVNKKKVRPVFDFRNLNKYVDVYSGSADNCLEKLRKWRSKSFKFSMLDLSDAYMQVRVHEDMWRYQSCIIDNKKYALTRMGFGLNIAPSVMTEIVRWVLNYDVRIREHVDSYIDDIFVDERKISVNEVKDLLTGFGLNCKIPESISEDREVRVLGLKVFQRGHLLKWKRDNPIREITDIASLSRRDLYSICGQLVGIYPVAGWLRPTCSYMKRLSEGNWEDKVGDEIIEKVKWVMRRVEEADPCKGEWFINNCEEGILWCDASSIAIGVLLEVKGQTIEDASWLRKTDDSRHINLAELEAVVKGLNLCIKWGMKRVKVKSDNKSVVSWISTVLADRGKLCTRAFSELLIKRRLAIIKELCQEYQMEVTIEFVYSEKNRADELTRVPNQVKQSNCCLLISGSHDSLVELHKKFHLGAKRMYKTEH